MALHFHLRQTPTVPLELQQVTPDAWAGQSLDDLRHALIYHGRCRCELGDFFDVVSQGPDTTWHFHGDCSGVHGIGSPLASGHIIVHGPAGRHLGSGMRGGRIEVHGNAGDWAAAEIHGGLIHIHGNAGDHVGSAYSGSPRGVTDGMILVDGHVGREAGKAMRRGILAIGGGAGELLAVGMLAGTILVGGQVGERCGAAMRRGTVVLTNPANQEFLPTIRRATSCHPLVLRLILGHVRDAGFAVPEVLWDARFTLYHADLLEGGRGEIFVREP